MQEILIVKSVLDYINDHSKEMNLPCELELEDIAPKGLSMSLQQISGEKYFEKDIVGNEYDDSLIDTAKAISDITKNYIKNGGSEE